jgi:hypothetical protein
VTHDDGSSADNCMCDGADDAMYTCDYHRENPLDEFGWKQYFERRNAAYIMGDVDRETLIDAYGQAHYKTGVYEV